MLLSLNSKIVKSSKIVIMALAATTALSTTAFAEEITLGAEDDWYPYSGTVSGEPKGFAVDIIREAYKTQGIKVNFLSVPYARCMEDTKQNKLLGCFDSSKSPNIAEFYSWHSDPMFMAEVAIYAKSDAKESNLTSKDLEGKVVGLTNGYEYGAEVDTSKEIKKEWAGSDLQNMKKVAAGRVQYTLVFTKVMEHLVKTNPELQGKLKRVGTVSTIGWYTAFAPKFKGSSKYVEAFNKGLAEIKKNGTYAKIEQDWK